MEASVSFPGRRWRPGACTQARLEEGGRAAWAWVIPAGFSKHGCAAGLAVPAGARPGWGVTGLPKASQSRRELRWQRVAPEKGLEVTWIMNRARPDSISWQL